MQMTVDGAGLLAQVLAAGLIAYAVEARALLSRPYTAPPTRLWLKRRSTYFREILSWRNLFSTIWALSPVASVLAIAACCWSVCTDTPLGDSAVTLVIFAGALLGVGLFWSLSLVIRPQDAAAAADETEGPTVG